MSAPNASSIGDYGMPVSDYVVGVTNAATDQPASGGDQQANDTAMMTRTACKALVQFLTAGASAPTLVAHEAQWGVGVAPVLARTGVGVYTVTWPASVTDQLGVAQAPNLRFAFPSTSGATAGTIIVGAYMSAPNVATVTLRDSTTGTAGDSSGFVISVMAF